MSPVASFDPTTFTSGRWDGGRGTVGDNPRFEYRSFDTDKGKVTVIEAVLDIADQEGTEFECRWRAAYADTAVIRESPDDDSEEAETGPSIAHRQPNKVLKIRGDSEYGQLLASLQLQGFPGSKLGKGDIRLLAGLDANFYQHARKKDDKYPILLVDDIFSGKENGAAKKGAAKKVAGKSTADDDAPAASTKKKGAAAQGTTPQEKAIAIIMSALDEADEPETEGTTVGDLVRKANKDLKGDEDKRAVMDLLDPDGDWLADSDRADDGFKYKKKTNSVVRL